MTLVMCWSDLENHPICTLSSFDLSNRSARDKAFRGLEHPPTAALSQRLTIKKAFCLIGFYQGLAVVHWLALYRDFVKRLLLECLGAIKPRGSQHTLQEDLYFPLGDSQNEMTIFSNAKLVIIDSAWGNMRFVQVAKVKIFLRNFEFEQLQKSSTN
ncbi:hypothetical protein P692DRAFT_20814901 [Suillus brevipes Sb2]|nr:hypothetical protein P692DRAFT_20814901 [Suillus brevipes Sb2]